MYQDMINKRWFRFVLLLTSVTIVSVFLASLKIYNYEHRLFIYDYWIAQIRMLIKVYLWTLIGFFVYWLSGKFVFEKKKWIITILLHLILSLIFSIFHSYLYWGFYLILLKFNINIYDVPLDYLINISYRFNFGVYWAIAGLCYSLKYYRDFREKERKTAQLIVETSRLETQLAKAQVEALKMQLQPHFLFNTLHTITGLMFKDVHTANKMIVQLSDLLRMTLDYTDIHEITLKDEMDYIAKYLEIQKIRFKEKLQVVMQIDPKTLNALVPVMILQPVIENSIEHGITPFKKSGKIKIDSNMANGNLILRIHDSGEGMKNKKIENLKGMGISNTVKRLEQMYKDNYRFELKDSSLGGLEIYISIPLKQANKG